MSKKVSITVNEKLCKQCKICSVFCPKAVLVQEDDRYPVASAAEKCVACKMCQMRCPDFAIEVEVAG